jgi:hypothetical protein
MSLEAWGDSDEGFGPPDGYVTERRAEEMFVAGAQACREMMARFVEQGGDVVTATSIRANWNPNWGKDPGKPENVFDDPWES